MISKEMCGSHERLLVLFFHAQEMGYIFEAMLENPENAQCALGSHYFETDSDELKKMRTKLGKKFSCDSVSPLSLIYMSISCIQCALRILTSFQNLPRFLRIVFGISYPILSAFRGGWFLGRPPLFFIRPR